jgi:tetratricopeptide (TPR) repeat protein
LAHRSGAKRAFRRSIGAGKLDIHKLRLGHWNTTMRDWSLFCLLVGSLLISGRALAATDQDYKDCNAGVSEQKVAGCTRIIDDQGEPAPVRARAYNNRANAYKDRGKADQAIADYGEALRLDPKLAIAYYNRGNTYQDKGDAARALADFTDAIRLDPKDASAFSSRGNAYQERGDFDRALADYNNAIRANPGAFGAFVNRGIVYDHKGDLDRAIADYSKAIRLNLQATFAYYDRGNSYRRKGDTDRALADYSEAIKLDPKFQAAYNNRGVTYRGNGDFDKAIADFDEAMRLDPADFSPYINRGRARFFAGSLAQALADFEQAVERAPRNAYAALWLALGERRNNAPGTLAQVLPQVDMTGWPAPLIRLFLGEDTADQALAAADSANTEDKREHTCEFNYYAGEWALAQNANAEALRLLKQAASDCAPGSLALEGAGFALKRLAATSTPAAAATQTETPVTKLTGRAAWDALVGNSITGEEDGEPLVEYYAPDGTAKSMTGHEVSTGTWTFAGDTVCFKYPDDQDTDCYKVEVAADSVTFYEKDGSGSRYAIVKGNPKQL